MKQEDLKELLPEIIHFANGGNLWYVDTLNKWRKQSSISFRGLKTENIIEDKHFEARKAHALGKTVVFIDDNGTPQAVTSNIAWSQDVVYRLQEDYEFKYLLQYKKTSEFKISEYVGEGQVVCPAVWNIISKIEESKRLINYSTTHKTIVSGTTDDGKCFSVSSDKDCLSKEFIMNLIGTEIGSNQIYYIVEVKIQSTLQNNESILKDLASSIVWESERLRINLEQ